MMNNQKHSFLFSPVFCVSVRAGMADGEGESREMREQKGRKIITAYRRIKLDSQFSFAYYQTVRSTAYLILNVSFYGLKPAHTVSPPIAVGRFCVV